MQGKAIKAGSPIPPDYQEVARARCRKCKGQYVIVHPIHSDDQALAEQHAAFICGYLEGEHVDPKHTTHLDTYEPLDWTDSN
jgi:hypothetical protein